MGSNASSLTKAHRIYLDVITEVANKFGVAIENIRDAAGSHKKVDLVYGNRRIIVTIYKAREQDQRSLLNMKRDIRRRVLTELLEKNA
jgi:hypothetical protein